MLTAKNVVPLKGSIVRYEMKYDKYYYEGDLLHECGNEDTNNGLIPEDEHCDTVSIYDSRRMENESYLGR